MKKATFMEKLRAILEDSSIVDLVRWIEYGVSFEVTNPVLFASQVLPRYFKHANFSSFIRQLHGYGYHKRGHPDGHVEFYHSELADPNDMNTVQRKYNTASRSTIDVLKSQVDELKEANRMLAEENDRLLKEVAMSRSMNVKSESEIDCGMTSGSYTVAEECAGNFEQPTVEMSVDDFFYRKSEDDSFSISPMDVDYFAGAAVPEAKAVFYQSPDLPSLHRIPSLNSIAGMDVVDEKQEFGGYSGLFHDMVDKYSGFF
jgi:FtsZ-binding cell division protein ZapB